ncbi:DUF4188 domain-containing protein [Xanthomonas sp. GW]
MVSRDRLTASLDGEFAVFLIGMRINKPLLVHRWLPVLQAMGQMIGELHSRPELGFLHAESWLSRTTVMIQYWRSTEQLLAYAKDRDSSHLPAWQAFNRAAGTDGSVGIWHETYLASPGSYENIYVGMPPFGLGRAGQLEPASGKKSSAKDRLRRAQGEP